VPFARSDDTGTGRHAMSSPPLATTSGTRPITVRTLLGDNTVPVLASLAAYLSRKTGFDLRFDDADGARSSDDTVIWRHDLVWACGLLAKRTLEIARRARSGPTATDTAEGAQAAIGEIVAAPVFPEETAACYHSVIVARPDGPVRISADVAVSRVVINEIASWSGCHALLAHLSAGGHEIGFDTVLVSGAHRRSAEVVAAGGADAAAIDSTIWRYLVHTEPTLTARLAVVERTADWPAPPFLLSTTLDEDVRERLLAELLAVREGDVAGLERVEACSGRRYREMLARAEMQTRLTRAMLGRMV